jgi:hypothetical protein
MSDQKQHDTELNDEETARRRDAVLGRMAATKPKPHKPISKSETGASRRKRPLSPKTKE